MRSWWTSASVSMYTLCALHDIYIDVHVRFLTLCVGCYNAPNAMFLICQRIWFVLNEKLHGFLRSGDLWWWITEWFTVNKVAHARSGFELCHWGSGTHIHTRTNCVAHVYLCVCAFAVYINSFCRRSMSIASIKQLAMLHLLYTLAWGESDFRSGIVWENHNVYVHLIMPMWKACDICIDFI